MGREGATTSEQGESIHDMVSVQAVSKLVHRERAHRRAQTRQLIRPEGLQGLALIARL